MASRTRRAVAHVTVALVATTLAAGCSQEEDGFAALGEREMERIVIRDMSALESVHMVGAASQGERKLTLDMVMTPRGDCSGTVTLGRGTMSYRQVDGAAYVRGNEAYWQDNAGSAQAAAQILSMVGEKWARLPRTAAGLGSFCDLDAFMREFKTDRKASGNDKEVTTVGEVSEVEGVDAVEVITKKGQETTVTWVAVDEPHVVLRIESAGGDQPGSFRLDGFDDEVEVTAPAAGDTVDLDQL